MSIAYILRLVSGYMKDTYFKYITNFLQLELVFCNVLPPICSYIYNQGSQLFRRPIKVSFRRLKETNFQGKRRPKGDHFRGKRRLVGHRSRVADSHFFCRSGSSIFKDADLDTDHLKTYQNDNNS